MNVRDKARPWFKFWPSDWLTDPALQQCSLHEQGALINLMAIAHGCDPYGYLVSNGVPMSAQTIAKLLRIRPQTSRKLLANLEQRRRLMRGLDDVWYIPRMVKDDELYRESVDYGRKGGRPKANPPPNPEADTEADTDTEPPTPRRGNGVSPEAIYQAYPKHVQKQAAIKAISKAIKSGRGGSFLLERVQAYAKATTGQDRQFIPYPASWFNAGSYDDDPSEWIRKNDSQAKAVLDMNDLMGSTQDKIDRGKRLLEEGDRKREKVRLERANIAKSD